MFTKRDFWILQKFGHEDVYKMGYEDENKIGYLGVYAQRHISLCVHEHMYKPYAVTCINIQKYMHCFDHAKIKIIHLHTKRIPWVVRANQQPY